MTADEKWTVKTVQIGKVQIQYEHRSPKCEWGRFGGGWDWKLGFQYSSGTLIVYLLTFSIRINKTSEKTSTPTINRIIAAIAPKKEPKRCQMCGDVLVNTELNDHDVERGVCHSCYAAEVTAGDTW